MATEEVQTTLEIAEGFAPWNKDIEKTATLEEVQMVWADAKISAKAVRKALTATHEAGASLLDKLSHLNTRVRRIFVDPNLRQYDRIGYLPLSDRVLLGRPTH